MTSEPQKEEAVNALAEYDDDTLAEMWDSLAKEADRLFRLSRGAHDELQTRMRERGGRKLDTEHWTGVMKPGLISHTVDDVGRFRERLEPHVGKDDLDAAFVQPPLPPLRESNRVLSELHERGGEVAAIIDEERRSVRGEGWLELKRKPEVKAG